MRPFRVYVDTSVFGGCFDAEFAEDSRRFFAQVTGGLIVVLVSEIVERELAHAPTRVRRFYADLPESVLVSVPVSLEVIELRDAYVRAGVVKPASVADATHVAAATAARADAIVSWNFNHIVRLDRIKAYNEVNLRFGWGFLTILSPRDVRFER